MPKGDPAGYLPSVKKSRDKKKPSGLRGRPVVPHARYRMGRSNA